MRIPVESTNIESVEYDESTRKLTVHFRSGQSYHYEQVTKTAFDNMMNAGSVGKHFNAHIRDAHTNHRAK